LKKFPDFSTGTGMVSTGTLETRVQISAVPSNQKNPRTSILSFSWRHMHMASKKLTRFERARLIGARALQISMGARPLVEIRESLDPVDIARKELEKKVMPLDVRRDK